MIRSNTVSKNNTNSTNKVLLLERLFFRKIKNGINISKIDVNSPYYDYEYEYSVRNPQMNYVYLLHEILLQKNSDIGSCLLAANNIEEKLLHPSFYREAMFGKFYEPMIIYLSEFILLMDENIKFVETSVSQKEFQRIQAQYNNICPTESLDQFIVELQRILAESRHICMSIKK